MILGIYCEIYVVIKTYDYGRFMKKCTKIEKNVIVMTALLENVNMKCMFHF